MAINNFIFCLILFSVLIAGILILLFSGKQMLQKICNSIGLSQFRLITEDKKEKR